MQGHDMLAADGPLAARLAGYSPRQSQLDMAAAIDTLLGRGPGCVLVEAGTGVGKSLAYLSPALLGASRAVVATGTKALQEQLARKDAPLVVQSIASLGLPAPRIEVVKGRNNYLCKLRYQRWRAQPTLPGLAGGLDVDTLDAWAEGSETGDRAELDQLPDDWRGFAEIDAGSETCVGTECPQHASCFVTLLRERARAADLIITNHHLLMADEALRLGQRFGDIPDSVELLPRHDLLIVDEAHGLPAVATDAFSASISSAAVDRLARDLREWRGPGAQLAELLRAVEAFQIAARHVMEPLCVETGRRPITSDALTPEGLAQLDALLDALRQCERLLAQDLDDGAAGALQGRCQRLRRAVDFICRAQDAAYVFYGERRRRYLRLVAAPIDVAGPLGSTLFGRQRAVVLTSATLATDRGFTPFKRLVGLLGEQDGEADVPLLAPPSVDPCVEGDDAGEEEIYPVEELRLDSPYPYAELVRYYLPAEPIVPDAPDHVQRLCDELQALCLASGGGAFLLFTSYRVLDAAYQVLQPRLDLRCLRQGEAPRHRLIQRFRDDGDAVLFGTQSFWQGVDVRGTALRLVVIDRLPFASPADPLHAARSRALEARGGKAFWELSLPQAILDLKQGVGRLVRSEHDRGVIALLDGRLRSKSYGRRFLRALPRAPQLRHVQQVRDFFAEAGEEGAEA